MVVFVLVIVEFLFHTCHVLVFILVKNLVDLIIFMLVTLITNLVNSFYV
jgi:hypothetical protein